MDIGIGLPVLRPDPGLSIVDWARRAEVRGFSTLGCTDRLVYDNYEPLTALAVAAGATSRIRLTTGILLAPLRANHALFAKSAATLDRLSGGRLVLGLAPGAREDDYKAGRLDFQRRGKLFDSLLETATRQWQSHDGIGPRPATPGGPQLLFGGFTKTALRRMVTYGRGWIGGAQGVENFRSLLPGVRQAWRDAGKAGEPRLVATAHFALGPGAEKRLHNSLASYYTSGTYIRESIEAGLATPENVAREVAAYGEAGCDELILFPHGGGLEQVDLLADVVGL
ncbi:LLM class flavin-dependent oxidoreductase [Streptomyces chiangmaiensis]|uniref:LLM class flavin-dependent oxidoreductase n=1 Tax=Streptomyces chiangmaiensis TaxID=766497 RepID=A0ABU7FKY5_9ACTN|nr:LLM class flavin-dependent oxidoreductase [Streptomyces chiangmaiensis]MED7824750.1 LLM class flavin-dependent oxidoreductase [Streptomyces chiangmaiensis]